MVKVVLIIACKIGVENSTLNTQSANGILGNEYPLDLYYAYGIRNGFGMDLDPETGYSWDTEN